MKNEDLQKELAKYPPDIIVCFWDTEMKSDCEIATVHQAKFDSAWENYQREMQGKLIVRLR